MATKIEQIENGRAAFAFQQIKSFIAKNDEKTQKEFKAYIKKMPSMIKVNGLGQTLAFYYSNQKSKSYQGVYQIIEKYFDEKPKEQELVEWVVEMDSGEYRHVTTETLALLNWMRRFAEGMVKTD
ncbi:type III-B CRISPR module-associated protein Cmr5 [Tindallia californiensis]|uniref:CRISPR type III-B/RAMP module-associated protein Cmr5 n=1 Tax=Tindallia californiensis TaxID=159292 RepID=A0A1H3PPA0_9FIRM|nr:type III-B CRISPR module-associated protein Cmr5 [Tindallia californiensis]SDZ03052.1 CRISPR-associated protein Cmr5 [Tindallia californiensis]